MQFSLAMLHLLSDGPSVSHYHFTEKSSFLLKDLETTPLWTSARCTFYLLPMINFAVVFVTWHKCVGVWDIVFSFYCVRKQEKPQALFSTLGKAQSRVMHSLFYKGKVFDGVWGIHSARMKMSLQRKWNEK